MREALFFAETLIFLVAAFAVAPIFQRLRSNLMLGYLIAGVIIGPAVFDLISDSKRVHKIVALGVVFLLFTIVLELNVDRLKLIRDWIFGIGTEKVVVTPVVIALTARAVGFSLGNVDRARAAVIVLENAIAAARVVNLLHTRFSNLNINCAPATKPISAA